MGYKERAILSEVPGTVNRSFSQVYCSGWSSDCSVGWETFNPGIQRYSGLLIVPTTCCTMTFGSVVAAEANPVKKSEGKYTFVGVERQLKGNQRHTPILKRKICHNIMKWYNDRILTDTDSRSWAPTVPCKCVWAVTVWPLTLNTATDIQLNKKSVWAMPI